MKVILPVGISFYTFQTLSYTIDVYRRKIEPTKDIVAFAAFVSFFPQLVAGPIERASNLLPQMLKRRHFNYSVAESGIRLILWGLFKKIAIADNLAPTVNEIFANYQNYTSEILILGAVFFAFQIYSDFSGYSDIARGLARLLGFELMVNFNFPYFSRSIGEFWRKWHISLSTWFRDYLYIPIGGSRVGTAKGIRNVLVIFLVSGFWHGANWTFIVWGGIHALLFIPSFIKKTNRKHLISISTGKLFLPKIGDALRMITIFSLVTFAWIFFRAESIQVATDYIINILSFTSSSGTFLNPYDNQPLFHEYILVGFLIITEYLMLTLPDRFLNHNRFTRIAIDAALFVMIIIFSPVSNELAFIYFQF